MNNMRLTAMMLARKAKYKAFGTLGAAEIGNALYSLLPASQANEKLRASARLIL